MGGEGHCLFHCENLIELFFDTHIAGYKAKYLKLQNENCKY